MADLSAQDTGIIISDADSHELDVNSDGSVTSQLISGDGTGYRAAVDYAGRVSVSSVAIPPSAATSVTQTAYSNLAVSDDTLYTITNGYHLHITRFAGGAESSTAGTVIELWEDPNGDLSVLNEIDVIFAAGVSDQHDLAGEFEGDGTRRILLRRKRLDGGSRWVFGRWEGFEES